MGLLKDAMLYVAIKKANEAINGKPVKEPFAEKEQRMLHRKRKEISKESRKQFIESLFLIAILTQFVYLCVLIVMQKDFLSWTVFYTTYAMVALVSCLLFFIGLMAYLLYLIDFLPMLFFVVSPLLVALIVLGFSHGMEFFAGEWMSSIIKLVFSFFGISIIGIGLIHSDHSNSNNIG